MYINTQKMKALLVTVKYLPRPMDQDSGKLEVVTDTTEIEQVASHKPLGLIIDEIRHISPYFKEKSENHLL